MLAHALNPALRRWRQKDYKFETSLNYIVRLSQDNSNKTGGEMSVLGEKLHLLDCN